MGGKNKGLKNEEKLKLSIVTMKKKASDHCDAIPHNRARPGLSSDSDIIHPCEKKCY
jgi:hypothetical protein